MVRPTQLLFSNTPEPSKDQRSSSPESLPRDGILKGVQKSFSETDSPYGELALTSALAHSRPTSQPIQSSPRVLDWQCESAVQLLKNVKRLTAPNPGVMTGPGTNTYIVGTPLTGYIVIDPGPLDPEHCARIFSACNGDVRMIVCTHSHADHSPGALPLQVLCEQNSNAKPLGLRKPPILGLASRPTARAGAKFTPDRELIDGECLVLEGKDSASQADKENSTKNKTDNQAEIHTLQVIFTPGHAANHVCLLLVEDGLLFSGDHVLNGSTTVVDPPDGHMGDYLNSLTNLATLCKEKKIEFIFPAHGYVLGNYLNRPRSALQVIENLFEHRMKREAKILKVVQQNPTGSMDDWVKLAYDDVPPGIWPVAKRSLTAHVDNLRRLGSI